MEPPATSVSGEGYSLLPRWSLIAVSSQGRRDTGQKEVKLAPSFNKVLILSLRMEPLLPNLLLSPPPLNIAALGNKLQFELWRQCQHSNHSSSSFRASVGLG